jgi:hypothetical protein
MGCFPLAHLSAPFSLSGWQKSVPFLADPPCHIQVHESHALGNTERAATFEATRVAAFLSVFTVFPFCRSHSGLPHAHQNLSPFWASLVEEMTTSLKAGKRQSLLGDCRFPVSARRVTALGESPLHPHCILFGFCAVFLVDSRVYTTFQRRPC